MTLPTAAALRERFDRASDFTVGLEEEVFVCHADGRYLEDADAVLAGLDPERFKPELPAGQLEIVTPPCADADAAIAELAAGRRELLATGGAFIAAGAHPTAPERVRLRGEERYRALAGAYGSVARRQLVGSLQVHVAVPGADRALATYNALRAHLPALAALAVSAPFHAGEDTGLASVRPTIATQLPRQGMPPALDSWEELAAAHAAVGRASNWWWELRPHPVYGTLEVRVCDAQPTLAQAARVVRAVEHVVRTVADDPRPAPPAHELAELRWHALRHGLDARMRAALEALGVEPPERTASDELREVGVAGAAAWLLRRFADGL